MARNKVKLAWISNDTSRRATFKKRKNGILKKTSELGILCGSDTCIILYNPYNPQPDIYPNNIDEVTRILSRLCILPEIQKSKNTMNQESYLREMIRKTKDQTKKIEAQIEDLETSFRFYEYLRGEDIPELKSETQLNNLIWLAENKLRTTAERIHKLRSQCQSPVASSLHEQEMTTTFQSPLLHQMQGNHPFYHRLSGSFQHSPSTSFIHEQPLPTSAIAPSLAPVADGGILESDDDNEDILEVTTFVENSADGSNNGDSSGDEGDLLVYPPHMLSSPEDLGHAYIHRPKPKDP